SRKAGHRGSIECGNLCFAVIHSKRFDETLVLLAKVGNSGGDLRVTILTETGRENRHVLEKGFQLVTTLFESFSEGFDITSSLGGSGSAPANLLEDFFRHACFETLGVGEQKSELTNAPSPERLTQC